LTSGFGVLGRTNLGRAFGDDEGFGEHKGTRELG